MTECISSAATMDEGSNLRAPIKPTLYSSAATQVTVQTYSLSLFMFFGVPVNHNLEILSHCYSPLTFVVQ